MKKIVIVDGGPRKSMNTAQMLHSSGVATTCIQTEGTMHGFDMAQRSEITQHQIDERCKWLSKW